MVDLGQVLKGMEMTEDQRALKRIVEKMDDLSGIQHIIRDTEKMLEANGGAPFPWKEYISGLAKELNTNERRIRRILRKAGLYDDGYQPKGGKK